MEYREFLEQKSQRANDSGFAPLWMDIRIDRVLKHRSAKDPEDEKHVHPLQLDVIERACVLYSNPGEIIFSPYMGVGSEVAGAVINDRRAIAAELKPSYFRQAVENIKECLKLPPEQIDLLGSVEQEAVSC